EMPRAVPIAAHRKARTVSIVHTRHSAEEAAPQLILAQLAVAVAVEQCKVLLLIVLDFGDSDLAVPVNIQPTLSPPRLALKLSVHDIGDQFFLGQRAIAVG